MYLQYGILGVTCYAVVEHAAWYFYRLGNNAVGYYSYPALVFVVLLANINRTVTRLLVLFIGMGFGVVKWTLVARGKIALLALAYLLFAFLYQLFTEMTILAKQDILPFGLSMTIIAISVTLDTLFYYWIVFSLIRTIQQLTLRRQLLKLGMYKIFFAILVFVGISEVLLMVYRAIMKSLSSPVTWRHTWILDAYREVLYFIVIAAIGFLWRPRHNNMRYGYAEFFEDDNTEGGSDIQVDGNVKEKAASQLTPFDKQILAINLPVEEDFVNLETEMKKMD